MSFIPIITMFTLYELSNLVKNENQKEDYLLMTKFSDFIIYGSLISLSILYLGEIELSQEDWWRW